MSSRSPAKPMPEPSDTIAEGSAEGPMAFEDLVAECLERFDQGGTVAVDDLLSRHPAESEKVRRALSRLHGSGLLTTQTDDGFPDRMGDFRLLKRIGGGGMGVVYLARQESLGREVALKLVRPDYLYFENARKRFQREVRAVSRLKHPGIVPVWYVGEEDSIPFFAMEYIPGCSLGEMLTEIRSRRNSSSGPIDRRGEAMREAIGAVGPGDSSARDGVRASTFSGSWEQTCLRITLGVAEAMCHAHEQNIIHRDLKPSNVMITLDGQVRLVDFGLATLDSDEKLTKSNSLLGSLNYMSPEQLSEEEIDERTDVYSLGLTLYEMLGLEVPFGTVEPVALRERILQGNLTPLRKLSPSVSRDMETICEKAVATRRDHRYQTMREFADDLLNLSELRPIRARPPSVARRTTRWVQRNAVLSLAMLLMLVTIVSLFSLWWQQRSANELLTTANKKLEASQRESAANLEMANKNFERAKKAIDEILTEVGDRSLRRVPYFSQIRKRLLKDALSLYEELAAQDYKKVEMQLELSDMERKIAYMHRSFGELAEAEKHARAAIERLAVLDEVHPSTKHRYEMGAATVELASILVRRGDDPTAHKVYREGIETLESVLQDAKSDTGFVASLASAYRSLANLYDRRPMLRPAEKRWQRSFADLALELRENIVRRFPEHIGSRDLLAREYRRLGSRLRVKGKFKAAIEQFDQALAVYDALLDEAVMPPEMQNSVAICYGEKSSALGRLNKFVEALEARDKEIELRLNLVENFPGYPEYNGYLSGAYNDKAIVYIRQRQGAEAEALLRKGLAAYDQVAAVFPRHPYFTHNHRNLTYNLCNALFQQSKHEELAKTAVLLPKRDTIRWRGKLNAAEHLGLALRLVEAMAPEDRPEKAWIEARRDEAFALLGEAEQMGGVERKRLDSYKFSALRKDPRFQSLARRVAAAKSGKK